MRKALSCFKTALRRDNTPAPATGSMTAEANLVFLHGRLTVKIIEARNVDGPRTGLLKKMERALTTSMDGVDPYCSVKFGYNSSMRTQVIENNPNPVWNASGHLEVAHEVDALEIRVKAAKRKGVLSAISKVNHLSMLSIPAHEIAEKKHISGWFELTSYFKEVTAENPYDDSSSDSSEDEHKHSKHGIDSLGEIRIEVTFTPIEDLIREPRMQQVGLVDAYYPVRKRVDVTMFQDTDVVPGSLPTIPFHPNYRHGRCWIQMSQAIMEASELIYISGWAVWPELKMVRTDFEGDLWKNMTLGDMLKKKAEDGVTVCVMVWDEIASNMFHKGLMGTHDEEVVAYFKGSKVRCIKVPRQNDKDGPFADLNDSLMFTHHQKTVIVSRFDSATNKNRLEAFVGGLDLTDGRYDNPYHSLFRTLKTVHAGPDYWQACALDVGAASGPREPWHDIHSKVTGAAAWDVLENFESRWRRQGSSRIQHVLHPHGGETFLTADAEEAIANGSWNVQILRSLNQSAADLDTTRPGLQVRRRALVDSSIHHAYIHAIRRAKNHIFLENQYFLGSSHVWDQSSKQRGGFSNHLIAIELAEKICAKIRAGQRFVAYLIVPMYPEGPPDSVAVQEILAHQRKTVSVITTRIRKALDEVGSETDITDWFAMFCLVNRESMAGNQGDGGTNEKEKQLSASRRFMIYVHSKFAIFDDEIAIIGSANINSRSMDGSRDSEIAAMCWQPNHPARGPTAYGADVHGSSVTPTGDVAAFRCAVWSEHLGQYFDEMMQPSSLECVRKVRKLALANWRNFAVDTVEPADMPHGHLAAYPYVIDPQSGEILETDQNFPDFVASITGGSSAIPNMLTG